MMIVVVMGKTKEVAEEFISELMHLFASRVQRLSAHHIHDVSGRIAYYRRFMTNFNKYTLHITVIPQVSTSEEIDILRQHGAFVVHLHQYLSAGNNSIRILHGDLLVKFSGQKSPSHVYDPSEMYSELMNRHRSIKAKQRQHIQTA